MWEGMLSLFTLHRVAAMILVYTPHCTMGWAVEGWAREVSGIKPLRSQVTVTVRHELLYTRAALKHLGRMQDVNLLLD
jgi:hypothetical protein